MKLSVIIAVYNTAADNCLEFCLDSLVNQTFLKKGGEMEIIAVDDHSTDNSMDILRFYESSYPEFFHVYQTEKNSGPGTARNIGFKHAKGEWITYIDSDDWVTPDCYEKVFAAERGGWTPSLLVTVALISILLRRVSRYITAVY